MRGVGCSHDCTNPSNPQPTTNQPPTTPNNPTVVEITADAPVDWGDIETCALDRQNLQRQILEDICRFHPECRDYLRDRQRVCGVPTDDNGAPLPPRGGVPTAGAGWVLAGGDAEADPAAAAVAAAGKALASSSSSSLARGVGGKDGGGDGGRQAAAAAVAEEGGLDSAPVPPPVPKRRSSAGISTGDDAAAAAAEAPPPLAPVVARNGGVEPDLDMPPLVPIDGDGGAAAEAQVRR